MPDTQLTADEQGELRHRELGLTDSEYELIQAQLGREPNAVELAMFSLMWSEHCGYKHSKKQLRRLPTEGPAVLLGPGENAGAVDIGDGMAVAFKVESHNHPSAVEPFQGAATGVGGILRDVFAVGARPIAVLDSLRFGEPESQRSRYLLEHAVAGIAHYGNSVGVPTVGGEIYFEDSYEQNCLINAMCLGIAPHARLTRAAAAGDGNLILMFGALTGRDGIGGASVLASAELDEGDSAKRPTVQIGDPFAGKKLLECSLELLDFELLVSLQDLGAAGLTSSASEMASSGAVGIEVDVAKVPLREADMEPFEVMVSESQERMLAVVDPSKIDQAIAVCEKWEVSSSVVGRVVGGQDVPTFTILKNGEVVGEIPVTALVDDCPLYDLEPKAPEHQIYPSPKRTLEATDPAEVLLALLESANITSRRSVFEQYDCVVQSRTVSRPQVADAAVLRLGEDLPNASPEPALAVAIDGNGRRVAADPYTGAVEAVAECVANLAAVGAAPLGLTNCLNFGNPEKPHVAWQLEQAISGLAAACERLDAPVVGGNVSLYNESPDGPIYPTPVVGVVGKLNDVSKTATVGFYAGDNVAVVGAFNPSLAASELAKLRGEPLPDALEPIDLDAVAATVEAVREAVASGAVTTVHDISEGGLAVALAECAVAAGVGAQLDLSTLGNNDVALFGEQRATFVVAGSESALADLATNVPVQVLGTTGGTSLDLQLANGSLSLPVSGLAAAHASGLPL